MIILLLSVTIVTIFKKYKNHDEIFSSYLEIDPKIEKSYSIDSFSIEKNEIHLHIKDIESDIDLIRTYNLDTGKLSNEIKLK